MNLLIIIIAISCCITSLHAMSAEERLKNNTIYTVFCNYLKRKYHTHPNEIASLILPQLTEKQIQFVEQTYGYRSFNPLILDEDQQEVLNSLPLTLRTFISNGIKKEKVNQVKRKTLPKQPSALKKIHQHSQRTKKNNKLKKNPVINNATVSQNCEENFTLTWIFQGTDISSPSLYNFENLSHI